MSLTIALNVIIVEIARVCALVGPPEAALAVLAALHVVALITRPVRPRLHPLPMLLVLEPIAHVRRPVRVPVRAVAVCLVVEPHTLINVAISVHQNALTVGLVVFPHALVAGGVGPDLHPAAMLLSVESLACVGASIGVLGRTLVQLVIGFNVSAGASSILPTTCGLVALRAYTLLVTAALVPILNLKLLPLLINVDLVLIVTLVVLLDGDFALGVGTGVRNAIPSAISH